MEDTNHKELLDFFYNKQPVEAGDPAYEVELCRKLMAASSAGEASIWELKDNGRLYLKYGTNITFNDVKDYSLSLGEGITGAAALTGQALKIRDAWSSPQHNKEIDKRINFTTQSMISAPVLYQSRLFGAINILNHTSGKDFPDYWVALLSSIAVLYAQTLDRAGTQPKKTKHSNRRIASDNDKTVIIGISRCIQDVIHLSFKAGNSKVPVLISGETGTGKELAAKKIHENAAYSNGPFLSINCAAISESLLESELFGHVKGAFSGAVTSRQGKFVAASGGTLFLDEIGEMSLSCQAKILRALQEKKVTPVGSDTEVDYDARIMAATNKNILELVNRGLFRKDLYYRLCGLEINIPPLRDRPSDIPLLVRYFIQLALTQKMVKFQTSKPPGITDDAMELLQNHPWPGNVRQLEQAVTAAMAVCDDTITVSDLPRWIKLKEPKIHEETTSINFTGVKSYDNEEAQRYLDVLEETRYTGTGRWNVSAAARSLNIPRKTFLYRLKKLKLKS